MTNEATLRKLMEMHLSAMAESFRMQLQDISYSNLSFEERFGILTDTEWTSRKSNSIMRLIKKSKFDQPRAGIADINYSVRRGISQTQISSLAECNYIEESHNIIIMGASGTGKSYIACALGFEACKRLYSVRYVRLPELLTDFAIARGEGVIKKLLKFYGNIDLLILDEWMLVSLKEGEARDLLEIIHARHKRASTIFCSQFAPAGWHTKIGEPTLADAILDRIVHDSHILELKSGKEELSMREIYGLKSKK